jgi:hypothetical protein
VSFLRWPSPRSRTCQGELIPCPDHVRKNLSGAKLLTSLARLEQNLEPKSEPTALEGDGRFQEYRGAGKLDGKKALITGGE